MTEQFPGHNMIAPIATVMKCLGALDQAVHREDHLPGIVALYGPSGVGKSEAAALAANTYQAYYVEMRSVWTKSALLKAILKEMGIAKGGTMTDMFDQICEELALSRKPLIIDEFDYAVAKNMIEVVRDIHEGSNAAILLIGEEHLSSKIQRKSERFHNRMLHWAKAEAASPKDAMLLRDHYCSDIHIDDDLIEYIRSVVNGCVRRICVNIDRVIKDAKRTGQKSVSKADWGDKELYTGSPRGRVAA
jgi:AAA domain